MEEDRRKIRARIWFLGKRRKWRNEEEKMENGSLGEKKVEERTGEEGGASSGGGVGGARVDGVGAVRASVVMG